MRIIHNILLTVILVSISVTLLSWKNGLGIFQFPVHAHQNNIPATLQRQFKRDAARLALRQDADKEDLRFQNITISKDKINAFYNVLSSIYLKDETAKAIARCKVHTFPNPSIDNFVIIFKRNVDWAAPLRQGITETNSKQFNLLLDKYDLVIDKHVQWNDTQDALTIRSKEPLNMAALANEFNDITGVAEIDLGIPKVAGNDIRIKRISGGWEVNYMLKLGAYGASDKQHVWVYKATDAGQVTFVKESGDPIPSWMKCNSEELTARKR